ncbi:MAG: hypothetical protein GY772_20785 [bacterium]|nr:hypothetical protein [Deltaproteobacteria bacterium]MCP4242997.1 hypothetical protein [bacterium]MDP7073128.1 hypothetical protein [Myxococcota bacterium]MDP7300297.1 hypothetical protein [Myxococcota bacterium]HJO24324.1 hypothetical protein [Myxococcota bacterium]
MLSLFSERYKKRVIAQYIEPGRAALTLYSIFIEWFVAFVFADSLTVEQFRTETRAAVRIARHGIPVAPRETPGAE